VSQQIVIYVAARVLLALAKLAVQPRQVGGGASGQGVQGGGGGWELFGNGEMRRTMAKNGWPVFASLSWAMVMYIFRWHPEAVQSSLRSSMSYMWVSFEAGRIRDYANILTVMFSRTIGIRYGRYFGITNEQGRDGTHKSTYETSWRDRGLGMQRRMHGNLDVYTLARYTMTMIERKHQEISEVS